MSNLSDQEKVRCFGSNAALTIEATKLNRDDDTVPTVNIDVAPRNNKNVDWSRKITLQLSEDELPIYASVLLGQLPICEFKRPLKGIRIQRQKSRLYITATAQGDGNAFALPIPIGQTFRISSLVLKQLKLQSELDGDLLIAAIKGAAALYTIQAEQ